MDFDQPEVWTVLFQVNYFCFEHIVIFCISDFLLYEYSSFSSSRNSFYTLESGRTVHKIQLISVLFWGPKTQLILGLNRSVCLQNILKNSKSRFGDYIAVVCTLINTLLIIVLCRHGIKCVITKVKCIVELKDRVLTPWGPSSISVVAELVYL